MSVLLNRGPNSIDPDDEVDDDDDDVSRRVSVVVDGIVDDKE